MRISETPVPTGRTSPGLPSSNRCILLSISLLAVRSPRLLYQREYVAVWTSSIALDYVAVDPVLQSCIAPIERIVPLLPLRGYVDRARSALRWHGLGLGL